MAIYRSDQAQLTFAAESAQGGDPEMIEGTLARSPIPTLGAAVSAGDRTITLSAEFTRFNTSASAGVQLYAAVSDTTTTSVQIDNNGGGDPQLYLGQVIQVDSESMRVTAISGTNNRTATVVRGYEGTTAATHSDNAAVNTRFTPGDFIRIGTLAGTVANTLVPHEVRRVESQSGTTVVLDRPLAFAHASGQNVRCVSDSGAVAVASAGSAADIINDNDKYITFIPGIYETVDTPDPEMSIEGRRFLNTQSKRNFSVAYAGQQTLTGSVSGIMLLNGWPLRFPIGTVKTTPGTLEAGTILLNGATVKGDMYFTADGAQIANLEAGDYFRISGSSTSTTDGSFSEVRRVVSEPTADNFKINYPFQFDHVDNSVINVVASSNTYYEHVIEEATNLDTVSWHIHMKDSDSSTGVTTKDFDRRYVGGMIGSSTITAEEGGMVTMSWDSVNFLNMLHNQSNQKTVGAAINDEYVGASVAANMPRFALMQSIDDADIGEPSHNANAVNNSTGYPSTQPYYFSEGTIKFFGQEFARIRSFSLSITNNEEPRYYIGKQGAKSRGPYEIREGARDYGLSASVALPDASVASAATAANADQDGALELFRQLLLEGDYGDGTSGSMNRQGFSATIKFERGTNDYIIIDIPGSSTAGSPTSPSSSLNGQGIFINSAPHSITTDNPFQIDVDMIFRSLKITVRDNVPVYP